MGKRNRFGEKGKRMEKEERREVGKMGDKKRSREVEEMMKGS